MKIKILVVIGLWFISCKEEVYVPVNTGMENEPLTDFSILRPDSVTYFNTSSLKPGKKTILFCYSPTCPYCRAQMREMLNNIDKYKDAQLLAVTSADLKSMKSFIKYFKLESHPNIINGIDTGNVMIKIYKAYNVPFTAFFDKDKRLTAAFSGRITNHTLLGIIHP
ncbi:peroxiredoxin [Chitinophaga sp. S165]|uniref:peroxiredoxin family protein n=1 Tax=Chitinophaga sp. S165 TaxID=2135462 RepID=UPI000D710753|nr:redoxin domain-containing protein [Chitinophaga sp. S165]PWV55548.1 thiol-disulfide isomerase/thioredoxin [Chitinophaga sp. S165]